MASKASPPLFSIVMSGSPNSPLACITHYLYTWVTHQSAFVRTAYNVRYPIDKTLSSRMGSIIHPSNICVPIREMHFKSEAFCPKTQQGDSNHVLNPHLWTIFDSATPGPRDPQIHHSFLSNNLYFVFIRPQMDLTAM